MNIDKLIRKAAVRCGVEVSALRKDRYVVHVTLTLDRDRFVAIQLSALDMDRASEPLVDDLVAYEIRRATEALVASLRFEMIRRRDPDTVWLDVGSKCPSCQQEIVRIDFGEWRWSCDGRGGAREHAMPARVWDGAFVRVRRCPEGHPVDCDCEGAAP